MEIIQKEFSFRILRDIQNLQCFNSNQECEIFEEIDSENTFPEFNVDRTIHEETKNKTTKSVILAPFNSSQSEMSSDYLEEEIKQNNNLIKFGMKVKAIDKEYEKNNNGEMDNGVYNKDSSVESIPDNLNQDIFDDLKGNTNCENIRTPTPLSNNNSQIPLNKNLSFALNDNGLDKNSEKPEILNSIVNLVEECGFPKEFIIQSLKGNKRNHATTTYYLFESKNSF